MPKPGLFLFLIIFKVYKKSLGTFPPSAVPPQNCNGRHMDESKLDQASLKPQPRKFPRFAAKDFVFIWSIAPIHLLVFFLPHDALALVAWGITQWVRRALDLIW